VTNEDMDAVEAARAKFRRPMRASWRSADRSRRGAANRVRIPPTIARAVNRSPSTVTRSVSRCLPISSPAVMSPLTGF
jgi:hypothetical protein